MMLSNCNSSPEHFSHGALKYMCVFKDTAAGVPKFSLFRNTAFAVTIKTQMV